MVWWQPATSEWFSLHTACCCNVKINLICMLSFGFEKLLEITGSAQCQQTDMRLTCRADPQPSRCFKQSVRAASGHAATARRPRNCEAQACPKYTHQLAMRSKDTDGSGPGYSQNNDSVQVKRPEKNEFNAGCARFTWLNIALALCQWRLHRR